MSSLVGGPSIVGGLGPGPHPKSGPDPPERIPGFRTSCLIWAYYAEMPHNNCSQLHSDNQTQFWHTSTLHCSLARCGQLEASQRCRLTRINAVSTVNLDRFSKLFQWHTSIPKSKETTKISAIENRTVASEVCCCMPGGFARRRGCACF